MISYLLGVIFTTYTFLLIIRVFGSWIPEFSSSRFMRFIGFYTDPYLNLFRKIIPPIGMIDLSPMLAFFALQIVKHFLVSIVG